MLNFKFSVREALKFYALLHALPESEHKTKFIQIFENALLTTMQSQPSEEDVNKVKLWLSQQKKKLDVLEETVVASEGDVEIQK